MSKGNKKLKQILDTAHHLFWKFGIKRITIEEVCSEAGVSKMTFYKHFKNKNELVKAIIGSVFDKTIIKYKDIMESNIPFSEKVGKLLNLKMEATDEISNEFLDDFYNSNDPELIRYLHEKSQANLGIMMDYFKKAQINGDIRKDLKPEFIIYFLNAAVAWGNDDSLVAMYNSPQDMAMEVTNFFFYGILPRSGKKAQS